MGSGSCVRIDVDDRWLNIYIDGIAEDKNNVSGLCGNYNEDSTDDFRTPSGDLTDCTTWGCIDFANLWKVAPEDSLFENTPPSVNDDYMVPELCRCKKHEGQEIECGPVTSLKLGSGVVLYLSRVFWELLMIYGILYKGILR